MFAAPLGSVSASSFLSQLGSSDASHAPSSSASTSLVLRRPLSQSSFGVLDTLSPPPESVRRARKIIQGNRNCFIRHRNWAGRFVGLSKNPSTKAAVITATSSASVCIGPALEVQEIRERSNKWQWNQYSINYFVSHYQPSREQPQSSSSPPVVLLVHGFGASIPHWRRNISTLSQYSTVYAIDLLGFGASNKPAGFAYTMETWADLILDFVDQVIKKPTVLVGNSVGSLACVIAASDSSRNLVRGLVLLNCAGGMNNKAIVDDWRIKLLLPLLWLFDFLLNQRVIASALFERVKKRDSLRNILLSVYGNKESVDEDLIDIIVEPANDEGALDAFVSIVTGPPGPSPVQLMPKISVPVLILWGDEDPFTPLDGPVGKYFSKLSKEVPNVSLFVLKGVGHCPHDDRPESVHEKLLPWLAQLPAL
ncbi:pheophytinase, chloroplastic isoform X2 [Benincasa hispida]|uniref:pheophytinase, chloroplastic isoform X2 n=1 Tax=Benincasa hispida TaxID=102211 RepID=UPI0018FFFFF6|nr:pheophytinase, chloroplastic isoform X2 [Benincasa hispida]